MRHAAQCIGRVLRGKTDYGIMCLADKVQNKISNTLELVLLDFFQCNNNSV